MVQLTVEATHPSTGEELRLGVEAGSHQQAAALVRDRGLRVRACYRRGAGFFKGVRVLAWVWFGLFAFLALSILTCGLSGWLATPGNSGRMQGLISAGVLTALAALGWLVARAMTDALSCDPRPDPRRGFEVLPADATNEPPPTARSESDRQAGPM